MTHHPCRAATLLAAVAAVVASGGSIQAASPTLPIVAPAAFYAAGGPVSAGPSGEILASLELAAPPGARKWAVIYRSTGAAGSPVGVSGVILAPDGPATSPRPVISLAHATSGLADACAPSRDADSAPRMGARLLPLIAQGTVVAATDYEGLGTPGPHPYIVGSSEGHAVLDAAVAAASLPETGAGSKVVLIGGSQGGHAVLWASQLAATAAPSLDIVGTVAFAPAADLAAIAGFDRTAAAGPPAWSGALALVDAWSQVYGLSTDVLSPAAQALLPQLDTVCHVEVTTQPTVVDIRTIPEWAARLAENTPGSVRSPAPILYIQGTADEQVPVETARLELARLCSVGDVVDYRELPGVDHAGSASSQSLLAAASWSLDRLAGKPATSTCP
jgi:hypothetical protein